jgi:hypothetical protein
MLCKIKNFRVNYRLTARHGVSLELDRKIATCPLRLRLLADSRESLGDAKSRNPTQKLLREKAGTAKSNPSLVMHTMHAG